jgi:hypothetical protein
MTAVETVPTHLTAQQLGQFFQYTVEAYKTFEKLAENLPNPVARDLFKFFAIDERTNRDLLEMKMAATEGGRVRVTLGSDMIFQEILEGEMSFRNSAEFLIGRERALQRRLRDALGNATPADRSLLIYFDACKRSHIVELERELELLKLDADWWKREDAEYRLVHGPSPE